MLIRSISQVRIVTFPPEILRRNSLLTNLVIDDNTRSEYGIPDCDNVFVYMSDSTNPALIVYDSRKDSAWRITHPFMFPDPDFGTYRVSFFRLRVYGVLSIPKGHRSLLDLLFEIWECMVRWANVKDAHYALHTAAAV